MPSPGLAPRKTAAALLDAVLGEGRLLNELLPRAVEKLAAEDRARATRLATTTLRWMDRADRILGPHLKKRPPLPVLNVLRLGVVEICAEGAAAHGVVNAAVDITRAGRNTASMAGLVNAVLRKVADTGPGLWPGLPQPQMPKWLRKPLIADYGKATVLAIEAAHAVGAPLDLTVKTDVDHWAETLIGTVLATGSVRLTGPRQVTALPGYAEGAWWVQDTAAALPAHLLAPLPGETVLDMCAAPGGKTLQLAAAGADVTALDRSDKRLQRLRENLARTGLSAKIVVGDALEHSGTLYDAVLLDAPCSATGTIRRHPDLPYAKDGSDFPALFALQQALIDQALTLLQPGGRLIYCSCSLLIDEGEEQIKDALTRHPGLMPDLAALQMPGVDPAWIGEIGLRTRPDFLAEFGGIDGFFMASMRKPA